MQITETTPTVSPKATRAALEIAQQEASNLETDLADALELVDGGREQLAAFAASFPAESARQVVLALRASRKALALVVAQIKIDYPEEA